jgi:hypothetical protein
VLTQNTYAPGGVTLVSSITNVYDNDGNQSSVTDADGNMTTFTHSGSRNQKRNENGAFLRDDGFTRIHTLSEKTPCLPLQPITRFAPSTKTRFPGFFLVSTA